MYVIFQYYNGWCNAQREKYPDEPIPSWILCLWHVFNSWRDHQSYRRLTKELQDDLEVSLKVLTETQDIINIDIVSISLFHLNVYCISL